MKCYQDTKYLAVGFLVCKHYGMYSVSWELISALCSDGSSNSPWRAAPLPSLLPSPYLASSFDRHPFQAARGQGGRPKPTNRPTVARQGTHALLAQDVQSPSFEHVLGFERPTKMFRRIAKTQCGGTSIHTTLLFPLQSGKNIRPLV